MNKKYARKATEHYEYPQVSLFNYIDKRLSSQMFDICKKDVVIYVHIPFCKNNCKFCNYFKLHENNLDVIQVYFDTLKKEILYYRPYISRIKAIQFGGGTPTCVPLQYYADLISFIKLEFECEKQLPISMESDIRELLKKDTIDQLLQYGIKRISFGVQTFNNMTRQALGISYKKDDLMEKMRQITSISQLDCNVDLMFNLPYQTPNDLLDDINHCFEAGVNCIDLYHLNIFPGTRMYRWMLEKKLLNEYYSISRKNDFYQAYQKLIRNPEINFCMSNTISKRQCNPNIYINMQLAGIDCWQIGIGASARGFVGNAVYRNCTHLIAHIQCVDTLGNGIKLARKCRDLTRRRFVLMPNLLKIDTTNLSITPSLNCVIERLIQEDILFRDGNCIELNPDYYFYAGNVSEEFYTSEDIQEAHKIVMNNYQNELNMYNQDKMNMR